MLHLKNGNDHLFYRLQINSFLTLALNHSHSSQHKNVKNSEFLLVLEKKVQWSHEAELHTIYQQGSGELLLLLLQRHLKAPSSHGTKCSVELSNYLLYIYSSNLKLITECYLTG